MSDLLSFQIASHQALMRSIRVRQTERHANVAVRRTLATSHARRPEALLRRGSVEPWDIEANAQPTILSWVVLVMNS